MRLSQWAAITQGTLIGGDVDVATVCTDTRSLMPGNVFFALKGDNFDAHDFLPQAQQQGAIAVVVECATPGLTIPQLVVSDVLIALGQIAAAWRQQFSGPLIAITGSCGKTTVKGMLHSILQQAGATTATKGNLNNHIGLPLTLLNLAADDQFAVIEMGASGRNEIAYLTQLAQPSIALVNNVKAAHVEGFGSLAAIAEEKQRIYTTLPGSGWAVINLDEPYAQEALAQTTHTQQLAFSVLPTPALHHLAHAHQLPLSVATNIRENASGAGAFDWQINHHIQPICLSVLGAHNVGNALAAATCAYAAGVSCELIARGLVAFTGEKGRMQAKTTPTGAILIDDTYNANPGSVAAAIDYLSRRQGRRLLVLGDMKELGADALAEHHKIGVYAAAQGISSLWLCGDLCRAAAAGFGPGAYHFASQADLLSALTPEIQAGDTLLIKGSRSSRMENIVHGLMATGESTAC